ncbi:CLIP domain-containing serine protease B8-like [Wyeomyia smithii]|uniref:CLIP domain-containing serine protease B8-like n=1 Tax=Wyeomyia smithii TaxID=174621 RepID=UPI002467EEDC|nr:CLIP domain-containing serine protease B8-like [Wyeomyia smithii]
MLPGIILVGLLAAAGGSQSEDEPQPVGESHLRCSIPNESTEGICVPPNECRAFQEINHPPESWSTGRMSFIRALQCSSDNETLICCLQGRSYQLPQLESANISQRYRNNSLDIGSRFGGDEDECGHQTYVQKIIGDLTEIDEFPWAALLFYRNGQQRCGGVLIGRSHVLTAAHCVAGSSYNLHGPLSYVRLREYDVNRDPDCMLVKNVQGFLEADCAEEKIDTRPLAIIIHPDYVPNSEQQHHDIALIRIDRIPNYTDFLQPICLPERGLRTGLQFGKTLSVCGWGKTNFFGGLGKSPVKMKSRLPFVDQQSCIKAYKSQRLSLGKGQICAGGKKNEDSCAGDSGSPLMFFDAKQGVWVLAGIVSRGAEVCGLAGKPGIFTNVREYLQWIKEHTY